MEISQGYKFQDFMQPTVSIITPTTYDREAFNRRIEAIGQSQDYPNIIEHLFDYESYPIGTKLNRLCNEAKGDIIVRFDSDDVYSTDYITKAVNSLITSQAAITGLSSIYYYDGRIMRKYTSKSPQPYICGATFVFWRSTWKKKPFKDINTGEDAAFLANIGKIDQSGNIDTFLATLHNTNTSSNKNLTAPEFSFVPEIEAQKILSKF